MPLRLEQKMQAQSRRRSSASSAPHRRASDGGRPGSATLQAPTQASTAAAGESAQQRAELSELERVYATAATAAEEDAGGEAVACTERESSITLDAPWEHVVESYFDKYRQGAEESTIADPGAPELRRIVTEEDKVLEAGVRIVRRRFVAEPALPEGSLLARALGSYLEGGEGEGGAEGGGGGGGGPTLEAVDDAFVGRRSRVMRVVGRNDSLRSLFRATEDVLVTPAPGTGAATTTVLRRRRRLRCSMPWPLRSAVEAALMSRLQESEELDDALFRRRLERPSRMRILLPQES